MRITMADRNIAKMGLSKRYNSQGVRVDCHWTEFPPHQTACLGNGRHLASYPRQRLSRAHIHKRSQPKCSLNLVSLVSDEDGLEADEACCLPPS